MNTILTQADIPFLSGQGGPTGVPNPVTSGLLMDIDFSNAATVFSDSARTVPAVDGGIIRGVTDLSGNGKHWSQTGDSSLCPVYRLGSDNASTYSDTYNNDNNYHSYYLSFDRISTIRSVVWVLNPWGSPTKAVGARSFLLGDTSYYDFHSDDSGNNGYFHSSYSTVNALWVNGVSQNKTTFSRLDTRHIAVATTASNSNANEMGRDRASLYNYLVFRGFLWRVCCYNTVLSTSNRQALEAAFIAGYQISV